MYARNLTLCGLCSDYLQIVEMRVLSVEGSRERQRRPVCTAACFAGLSCPICHLAGKAGLDHLLQEGSSPASRTYGNKE